MQDTFETDYVNLSSPAVSHYAVVPSDSADLPVRPRALFVNASGAVVLRDASGTEVSYEVQSGAVLSIRPVRVMATGTTAQLIAWY